MYSTCSILRTGNQLSYDHKYELSVLVCVISGGSIISQVLKCMEVSSEAELPRIQFMIHISVFCMATNTLLNHPRSGQGSFHESLFSLASLQTKGLGLKGGTTTNVALHNNPTTHGSLCKATFVVVPPFPLPLCVPVSYVGQHKTLAHIKAVGHLTRFGLHVICRTYSLIAEIQDLQWSRNVGLLISVSMFNSLPTIQHWRSVFCF